MKTLIESTQELLRFAIAERDAFYDCSTDAEGYLTDPGDQAELDRMDQMIDRARNSLSGAQQGGELYQIRLPNGPKSAWYDATEEAYHCTDTENRRVIYTAPQPAQVPEGWRLVPVEPTTEMLGEGAIALFAQSREPLSSAYRNMLAAAPRCPMLTAAPSGDAKREAEDRTPIIMSNARRMIKGIKTKPNWWLYSQLFGTGATIAKERCRDAGIDPEAARLRQSSDGDDSEGVE